MTLTESLHNQESLVARGYQLSRAAILGMRLTVSSPVLALEDAVNAVSGLDLLTQHCDVRVRRYRCI